MSPFQLRPEGDQRGLQLPHPGQSEGALREHLHRLVCHLDPAPRGNAEERRRMDAEPAG